MAEKNWLEHVMKKSAEEVKRWPEWMQKAVINENAMKQQKQYQQVQCMEQKDIKEKK